MLSNLPVEVRATRSRISVVSSDYCAHCSGLYAYSSRPERQIFRGEGASGTRRMRSIGTGRPSRKRAKLFSVGIGEDDTSKQKSSFNPITEVRGIDLDHKVGIDVENKLGTGDAARQFDEV